MIRTAADIYEQLKSIHRQLEQLGEAGRITRMDSDKYNTEYADPAHALMTALEGIEKAVAATCWMVTDPASDGEFPELTD